jgi:iron complex outermembrane receptor protein
LNNDGHSPTIRRPWAESTAFVLLLLATITTPLRAQDIVPSSLREASLEDLMNVEVTSVSKREEQLPQAAAAVFVIGQEQIRRSGATSIAEVLRLVPGLQVSRIDGNKWAISSRGFNNRFANKMLVLIDGRSVYSSLFSGVFWDIQDTMLEDVERIEVIRGPGATMWGANAVNGVINVITRDAARTQGGLATAGAGSVEGGFGSARYGIRLGDHAHMRIYGRYFDRTAMRAPDDSRAADAWHMSRGGFRLDWKPGTRDDVMVTGDIFDGQTNQRLSPGGLLPLVDQPMSVRSDVTGANVLGRWTRELSPRASVAGQIYVDDVRRDDVLVGQTHRNLDVDLQHHVAGARHAFVWGGGFRRASDILVDSPILGFSPAGRVIRLFSVFAQDEYNVVPDRLRVTVGTKLEHNSFTEWEVQPTARAAWTPHARHTVWGAVSRAVRTPSRAESDVSIRGVPQLGLAPLPVRVDAIGDPGFRAEVLVSQEVGYRVVPAPALTLDLTAFANRYDHLRSFEPEVPQPVLTPVGPMLMAPLRFGNNLEGTARGVEGALEWTPWTPWRVAASYGYLDVRLTDRLARPDQLALQVEDDSPRHRWQAQSYLTLPHDVELDVFLYRVGQLRLQQVPAYTRLDVRAAWRARESVEFSVVGQNLTQARHREFGSVLGEAPSFVPRGVYGQLRWRF